MKKVTQLFLAVLLSISFCRGQVPSTSPYNGVVPAILNTAGGTYDNPGSYYRYEWSFGELLLIQAMAPADSSILVTHGVLQPFTDIIGKSPLTLLFENGDYKLFPNPTSGKFEINFFVRETGQMSLLLIDASGRILEKRSFRYDESRRIQLFDLTRYPDGVYMVVADLKPDRRQEFDNVEVIRHSGLKVIKLNK